MIKVFLGGLVGFLIGAALLIFHFSSKLDGARREPIEWGASKQFLKVGSDDVYYSLLKVPGEPTKGAIRINLRPSGDDLDVAIASEVSPGKSSSVHLKIRGDSISIVGVRNFGGGFVKKSDLITSQAAVGEAAEVAITPQASQ